MLAISDGKKHRRSRVLFVFVGTHIQSPRMKQVYLLLTSNQVREKVLGFVVRCALKNNQGAEAHQTTTLFIRVGLATWEGGSLDMFST